MRNRVLAGAAVIVVALAVPAFADASSYLFMQQNRLDQIGPWYGGYGPAQDVTVRVRGHGDPALTGDQPGAQRIDVSDARDTFADYGRPIDPVYYDPTGDLPGWRRCHLDSAHDGHCDSDWTQQLTYSQSHCNFPPDCTGPGASGLLEWMSAQLSGTDVRLRDVAGDTPVPWYVSADATGGTRDIELYAARSLRYDGRGDSVDEVELHPGVGASELDLGPGDDKADVENGAADQVRCGDGADSVKADPADTVAADCETVVRG